MENRTLYLVRHGQRLDAVDKSWKGDNKYDPPLSELGFEQAWKVGVRLRQEPIDVIIASPYLRTLQTAQTVAEALDRPFYVDEGVGEWQGRSMMSQAPNITPPAERAADFPCMDLSHQATVFPEWPETVNQVFERYRKVMAYLLETYEGNLLIVGHGRVVTGVPHVLTGKPESKFKYEVACLTMLEQVEDKWQVCLNGDTTHLTEETNRTCVV